MCIYLGQSFRIIRVQAFSKPWFNDRLHSGRKQIYGRKVCTRHIFNNSILSICSYLQRFLDIGSHMRRLESFVHGLRDRSIHLLCGLGMTQT